ncbi:hypothetical protein KNO15_01550 [Leifsonia shinshuensis]|uniref:hypothetical protein n=1 Tax=Leifsonia shinshuensis TaxID=150026 RepID=UPI001F50EBA2|nr:hypothetical protein [Leifsonia shinshuensis]MCI0155381.1 hypothetical protein [Leifsonia shinshuensis]
MPQNPPLVLPDTALKRRTLVGAAAWSAPAIVLASAAPAYATSTAQGAITFLDPADIIGGGYTQTFTVQLTVQKGASIPANVAVAYSVAGVVSGPTSVPTGGRTTVAFSVTGLDVNGSTDITVSAPNFIPATTNLLVTWNNALVRMQSHTVMNVADRLNVAPETVLRSQTAQGHFVDHFTGGKFLRASTAAANTMKINGMVLKSRDSGKTFDKPTGSTIKFQLDVITSGGERLIWQAGSAAPNAGKPIGGTTIIGNARLGTTTQPEYPDGGNQNLPIVRQSTTTAARPGGFLTLVWTLPQFPNYHCVATYEY